VLLIVGGLAGFADAQATGGLIQGALVDEQGAALPGATLTLRNVDSGVTRTVVSEGDGRYRFAAVPPGRYDLTAELSGFATVVTRGITMTIGLDVRSDVVMRLQALEETVTVTAQAPVIETARSEVAAVVTQAQIDSLPIEGRVAVSLALLLPGTGGDNTRPRRNNANVGAGGLTQFSTNFLVDGAHNMSSKAGEPRQDFPQSAIQEFRVHVSQSPAEYGGRTGGVVTVVTKSGTNRFSGEAFEFFRDKSLNALNMFEQQLQDQQGKREPDFRQHLFGGALGGPIIRDRLHFFVAAERTAVQQSFTVNTGQPQFYAALEGTFRNDETRTRSFGRGDFQINPQQNVFARYGRQGITILCEGCGGINAASTGSDLYLPADSVVAGHTWVLSSRALNEVRFQKAFEGHFQGPPGVPRWTQAGVFTPERYEGRSTEYVFPSLTWGSASDLIVSLDYWEVRNDFSINTGNHAWKIGGVFQNFPIHDDVPGNPLGTWTFGADQPFDGSPASVANLRNPIQFTAAFPPLVRDVSNHHYAAYIQDDWRPRSNVTFNLGLRYDLQTKIWNENLDMSLYPRPLPYVDFASRGDGNNVAPRFGFAWDLNSDSQSVLRGGYGLVYQDIMTGWHGAEMTTLRQTSINIRNPSYPDPYQRRDPLEFASTAPPNISIVDSLVNPPAQTFNLGFSQELRSNMALHVDGVYTRTSDFPVNVNVNTPDPTTRQRPLPEWGRIVQSQPGGEAKYRALFVRLDKRFANRHQYLVSYTLAKHENNWQGGTSTGNLTDFYNPGSDWGPANNDRRHALVASGAVLLPLDMTVGAVWTLRSSLPFSAQAGSDLNADGANTDYVPGTTKNLGNRDSARVAELVNAWRAANGRAPLSADQFDGNQYSRLDLRASKSVTLGGTRKIELIGQVFNVLGADILGGPGSGWVINALSDSFGRLLTAQPRQQAELAVRLVW
jgi:hypothetical protein